MSDIRCEALGAYISQIHRKSNVFITKKLSKYGLGSGQYMFLLRLYREDGINQEALAEGLMIDKGTTARAIKKLEEVGLIYRVKDEADKRAYGVFLSDKAKNIKAEVFDILNEWEDKVTNNLEDDEKIEIMRLLKKVSINDNIR
ncbi:MAG: MarR family winged helix-turn-helix transcriptional regulator [Clostridium sp.]